jgi:hypothetical protein
MKRKYLIFISIGLIVLLFVGLVKYIVFSSKERELTGSFKGEMIFQEIDPGRQGHFAWILKIPESAVNEMKRSNYNLKQYPLDSLLKHEEYSQVRWTPAADMGVKEREKLLFVFGHQSPSLEGYPASVEYVKTLSDAQSFASFLLTMPGTHYAYLYKTSTFEYKTIYFYLINLDQRLLMMVGYNT